MSKRKGAPARKKSHAIRKTMQIQEIVTLVPEAKSVLEEYGLHCFSCAGGEFENLQDGCRYHGFSDEETDELVDDLNKLLDDLPTRPQMLTITAAAAREIRKITVNEADSSPLKSAVFPLSADFNQNEGLAVIADAAGGFCMEFRQEPDSMDRIFENPEEPGVRVFASFLTLRRIGGASIDFRDGRFKLDLPEDDEQCSIDRLENGGICGCKTE